MKPLGILYIGSYLKNNGYDVELFDFMDRYSEYLSRRLKEKKFGTGNFNKVKIDKPIGMRTIDRPYYRYGVSREKFAEKIKIGNYDCIFLTSMMTYWYQGVQEVIETVRKESPETKIILGGVYPRLLYEHASSLNADKVYNGDIKGFFEFCNNEAGIKLEKRFGYQDIVPLYELYRGNKSAAILTQLGCNFKCTYCAVNKLYPKYERFSPDYVLKQLDYLKGIGIEDVAFYDDAILFEKESHFIPLMKRIIEKKYPMRFHFSNGFHSRFVDDEVARIIKALNTGIIALSVETISDKTGGKSQKELTDRAIEALFNAGIENWNIYAYIMIGMEEESLEDVILTVEHLRKKQVRILINEVSPVPHTPFYEK
ncbi:TPA: hypothetical protein DCW38_02355, partial [candidate division WOR-3 bacterium]|nr:hypothetical protein [candidate division WOR-3 bacterium]